MCSEGLHEINKMVVEAFIIKNTPFAEWGILDGFNVKIPEFSWSNVRHALKGMDLKKWDNDHHRVFKKTPTKDQSERSQLENLHQQLKGILEK